MVNHDTSSMFFIASLRQSVYFFEYFHLEKNFYSKRKFLFIINKYKPDMMTSTHIFTISTRELCENNLKSYSGAIHSERMAIPGKAITRVIYE